MADIPTQERYKRLGIKRLSSIVAVLEKKSPWDLPQRDPTRLRWVRASNALGTLKQEAKTTRTLRRAGSKSATVSGRSKGRVPQSILAKMKYSSC